MKFIFALFYFLFVCSNLTYSQNKIYLPDEVKDGKVIEITPREIKYTDTSILSVIDSVPRNKTLLLFNDKGGFLVVSKPDSSNLLLSKNLTDNFINAQNDTTINTDRIFTRNKKIINCIINNEDILAFFINLNGVELKVDKSTVAVVIYKNGEHTILSDIVTAADVLYTFQMQDNPNAYTKSEVTMPLPAPAESNRIPENNKNSATGTNTPKSVNAEVTAQQHSLTGTEQAPSDSILAAKEIDKKYLLIVAAANSLAERGEYSRAKYFYSKANELKPNEREPLDGIDRVNKKLLALDKLKGESADYDGYIAIGDSLVNSKQWDSALVVYNKAKAIRPQDYYVNQEIKYVESEINNLKIEAQKEAEIKFNNAIARADIAVKEKRYEDALAAYNEALSIHADSQYAIDRTKILSYQISLQKKDADH